MDNTNRIDDYLRGEVNESKHEKKQLIKTIASEKLKDEVLMEYSLGVSEDIDRTVNSYNNVKKGSNQNPF